MATVARAYESESGHLFGPLAKCSMPSRQSSFKGAKEEGKENAGFRLNVQREDGVKHTSQKLPRRRIALSDVTPSSRTMVRATLCASRVVTLNAPPRLSN